MAARETGAGFVMAHLFLLFCNFPLDLIKRVSYSQIIGTQTEGKQMTIQYFNGTTELTQPHRASPKESAAIEAQNISAYKTSRGEIMLAWIKGQEEDLNSRLPITKILKDGSVVFGE